MGGSGKRSRNPSTSSGYGYRSRRASEGDEGSSARGGSRSRGSSRHTSGSKPYRGRHSDQSDGWVFSSSYQEKLSLRQGELGRKNPSGPRKRANSASDKVVTVTKVDRLQAEQ